MQDRYAIQVLNECAELMRKKGKAYNRVPQTQYYEPIASIFKDGIDGAGPLYVMMHQKMIRILSLMSETGENEFEGIEDSCRDLINYTAFMVEYLHGEMDGQRK